MRQLLPYLPAKVRFALMRSQLKVSNELDAQFSFRIARTQEELSEAYRILHDSYLELGYSSKQEAGMRIVKYFALPSTTTLIALFNNQIVGTISIIRRGSFGLPMETAFDLSDFINRNEVVAEISSLAIDTKFRQKRGALFLPLLKYFWEYVEGFMNLDSIVITVNPSMSDFYEGFLGFRRLQQAVVTNYSFANGNPGIGLYLNVKDAPTLFQDMYGHKKPEKNLYRYFVDLKLPHFEFPHRKFYKSSDPVMTPGMLDYFFNIKSKVFSELTVNEKMGLAAVYPNVSYQKVLPQVSVLNQKRKNTRFSVNLKGTLPVYDKINMTVLDVSGDGICLVSPVKLEGIIFMQVQVAQDRTAEARGVIRWEDRGRKIYGIHLLKTDSNWSEFVKYLNDDFNALILEGLVEMQLKNASRAR